MGLFNEMMAYIQANTPRNTRKPANAGTVIDNGLFGGRIGQVPQRAQEITSGLLKVPAELAQLGSPSMKAKVDRAMTNPAAIDKDKAMGMAMDFLQTSTPIGGAAGIFIGKGAKTWDAIAAQQADDLLKQGIDPREVWKQTGTLKGVDGAWRQEIPDNLAAMRGADPSEEIAQAFRDGGIDAMKARQQELAGYVRPYQRGNVQEIDNVLEHGPLGDAYPDLYHYGKYQYDAANPRIGEGAYYSEKPGSEFATDFIKISPANEQTAKSTMVHELQHAIQQREGWAKGGSPDKLAMELQAEADLMRNKAKGLFDLSSANDPLDPGRIVKPGAREKGLELERQAQKLAAEAGRINEFAGLDHDAYRRLAGEAEARLTQSRMGLDASQRLQHYPYDQGPYGLDVPLDSLIVRGLLDGPAMSVADDAAKVARQPTQYELAHQVAQKNAVDMLGLPPNNTAMDRARAMGFDTPAWRGSDADEVVSRRAPYGAMGAAHYSGDDPIVAAGYAGEETGANVLPLLLSGKYADNKTWSDLVNKAGWDGAEKAAKDSGLSGVHDSMFEDAFATFEPKNIRSRFAAFDPAKRNSSDLLAGLAPYIGVGGLLSLGLMAPEQANQ